jgi:hypothetical protein
MISLFDTKVGEKEEHGNMRIRGRVMKIRRKAFGGEVW